MAVGFKAFKAAIVVLSLVSASHCLDVKATTVSDLYELYDKRITEMYSESTLETIADYQRQLRSSAMYEYVKKSTFDNKLIEDKIKTLESELNYLETQLLNSYDEDLSTIYELEDDYETTKKSLENTRKSSESFEVKLPDEKTFSKNKYKKALRDKNKTDYNKDIGTYLNRYPVSGDIKSVKSTEDRLELYISNRSTISPLFNGKVSKVTDDSITLSHDCGIYSYYRGLEEILVNVGDTVYQGQKLGYSSDVVILKFKINGDIVDVSKLFQEE